MRIPLIIAVISLMPSFAFSQEETQTQKANRLGRELVDLQMKGAELLENFGYPVPPEKQEEYQSLQDAIQRKETEFFESGKGLTINPIAGLPNPNESPTEPTPAPETKTTPVKSEQPQKEQKLAQESKQEKVTPPAEDIWPDEESEETETFLTEDLPLDVTENAPETITETTTVEIPAEPEPTQDEPVVMPEETKEEQPTGIDTVSLENPQGNWLYKRIWWERAEERYEKIRLLVDSVWEFRTSFFVKRNELDRNVLDPFYLNVGIGQGELQVILGELVDFLEKNREREGDLNEQERMLYERIMTEEESLKQLKSDIESIANLDHAIDDALGTLMNQINRVRQFERQAWENFKEIAHILNDTKARELYYMIEGAARNIKNISNYLEQEFFQHFNRLINEATKHINKVQSQMESLKEKGVNFKRQTELLAEHTQALEETEEEEEEVTPKPKVGWFGWIMSGFNNFFNMVWSVIKMPYNMIFGK